MGFILLQVGNSPFNRGMLLNIGFLEALKEEPTYNCFMFHDVDLILESNQTPYACSAMPMHLSTGAPP